MSGIQKPDWDPQQALTQDQRAHYDRMREQCPVAYSDYFQWSLFRHQDVLRTLLEPSIFSSQVSTHVSVPNGMDEPEHGRYRRLIEPYFSPQVVAKFKPICQAIAAELVAQLDDEVELISALAEPFAARVQCAFMGWPQSLAPTLLNWVARNNQAILKEDRPQLKALALEFEQLVSQQLDERRGTKKAEDLTTQLLQEEVAGRALSTAEITSILRNWTVGEVGTIANAIGIIVHFLATHADIYQQLRAKPERLAYANNEIQRLHNPLVDNRRRSTCPVSLSGRQLPQNAAITINWVAANRDPLVFTDAQEFRWDRDPSKNLLYGAGIHLCPGAELAQMELIVVIRELLQQSHSMTLSRHKSPTNAHYPRSGYAQLPITFLRSHSAQG